MAEYKGFDPSSKKLRNIRKQGQVLKLTSIAQTVAFIILFYSIFNILHYMWSISPQMLEYCFRATSEQLTEAAIKLFVQVLIDTSFLIAIPLLIAALCANLVEILQVGFEFHWNQLLPRTEKFDLIKGFQRQVEGLKKALFILFKLFLAISLIGYLSVDALKTAQFLMLDLNTEKALGQIFQIDSWIYRIGLILLIIAISEYLFLRRQFINRHSMSIEEVKKEIKDEEGDPYIRAQRKSLHEAMIMQEVVKRVRASKLIIVDE